MAFVAPQNHVPAGMPGRGISRQSRARSGPGVARGGATRHHVPAPIDHRICENRHGFGTIVARGTRGWIAHTPVRANVRLDYRPADFATTGMADLRRAGSLKDRTTTFATRDLRSVAVLAVMAGARFRATFAAGLCFGRALKAGRQRSFTRRASFSPDPGLADGVAESCPKGSRGVRGRLTRS